MTDTVTHDNRLPFIKETQEKAFSKYNCVYTNGTQMFLKNKISEDKSMNEFAIAWLKGADYAEVSAPSGSALKSKLLALSEQYPDEVTNIIINKDGSIFCHVPVSYVKVRHPKIVSDELKEAASERLKQMWKDGKMEQKEDGFYE